MKKTKEIIVEQALELFSTRGYDSVSVQEIAIAVGIKAPSLYKHFRSKQEMFEAILETGNERFRSQAAQLDLDGGEAQRDSLRYQEMNTDQLVELGKELFLYFLHEPIISKTRRMLSLEQYKNPELGKLFSQRYIDEPLEYQSELFSFLCKGEPSSLCTDVMALQFYAPIYLMLVLCDVHPEREEEALKKIEEHIRRFSLQMV